MRIYITILSLFFVLSISAQSSSGVDVDRKIDALETSNSLIIKRLRSLELENFKLLQKLDSIEVNTQTQLNRSSELQAQNERSLNLALDGFATKFEKQNETVKDVESKLSEGFVNQLIMVVFSLFVLTLIYIYRSKKSTQKALETHMATWNQFQEHILKK